MNMNIEETHSTVKLVCLYDNSSENKYMVFIFLLSLISKSHVEKSW